MELPDEFVVILTVNCKEYHVKWFNGYWQVAEMPHSGGWRTLDELVDCIYKNKP